MPARKGKDGLPIVRFASAEVFEAWIVDNREATGLWVEFAKKGSGVQSVTYQEAVEVALCHGWIDGQTASVDERYYLQRFTPRRAKSKWSQINVEKAEALIACGRMRAGGLAEIEAAKRDGRWAAAYPSPSRVTVPEDLRAALVEAGVLAVFEGLDGQSRYRVLYQVHDAKKAETRARRIASFVAKIAAGEKIA